jgi:hypothetical protein
LVGTKVQRRAHERIPASLVVKFSHCDSTCYGIVTNISEKGMCINSGVCLPYDSKIKLHIPLKNQHLALPVKVRWVAKTNEFYDTMGVELLNPTKKYLQIVSSIKGSLKTV